MYAVLGATGLNGGQAAAALRQRRLAVRAVVRDESRGRALREMGCELAVADIADVESLAAACTGVDGVFVMLPTHYDATDVLATYDHQIEKITAALEIAKPPHVVALSAEGSEIPHGTGLILTTRALETALGDTGLATTILRCPQFMENWRYAIEPARRDGVFPSFLTPLERRIRMVSAIDVGEAIADALEDPADSTRIRFITGPHDYSPADAAQVLSDLLAHDVRAVEVARSQWMGLFTGISGCSADAAHLLTDMYDAFNAGKLGVEPGAGKELTGSTTLKRALTECLAAG
ncbi:NAD(P)H-binding protein [Saccharopolyspora erythraea]|uniref:NmrA family NAD(P)-binding protein n=1 Tax=Saccharopolyspora erythraea TaxID=1836 RepID=UPI001BAE220B|nr:NAD(P)H-binding protein [Saccharopolyspora erythraea]QUH03642.1 NAD(P)H-binding protein [Saccharopolyspora erythraea]